MNNAAILWLGSTIVTLGAYVGACVASPEHGSSLGTQLDSSDSESQSDDSIDSLGESCEDEVKQIYVVDLNAKLYRFAPEAKLFDLVGTIECPASGSPFSMAIARSGIAYVLYVSERGSCQGIWAVDVHSAQCLEKTGFTCGSNGFGRFGMGFASDDAGSEEETLYLGKADRPYTLATVSLSSWEVESLGDMSDAPEMSGTGGGELWGYFALARPPFVARLDKGHGGRSKVSEAPVLADPSAFAFAHWGGDYFLFSAEAFGITKVWRLHNGQVEEWIPNTGLFVVGAGVSTCAPFSPF